jgi:hypothetical protein
MRRIDFGRFAVVVGLAWAVAGWFSVPALAQPVPGGTGAEQLQRQERIRELEQLQLDTRLRANEAIPPGQRTLVDYGAYLQLNYLSLEDNQNNNHGLREVDFYPYLRLNFDGAQEVFIRGRLGYQDFNPGDSFDGRGDQPVDPDLDRAYYRFDLRRYNAAYNSNLLGARGKDFNLTFEGGRDFVYWANGLVLAQTLDGVSLDLQQGILDLQLLAGVTITRTVDIDTSRPNFDHNTRRGFYGAMLSAQAGDNRPYVYGMLQRDYNQDDELQLGIIDTKYLYNSYYLGIGSSGSLTDRLRYGVEFTYEGGETLSNSFTVSGLGGLFPVDQTRDAIDAFAFDGRLDYLFNDPHQTRLSFEFIAATGDPDRGSATNTFNGNAPGTKDHGFNAFGLLNTGLAFSPDVSNLMVARFGVATLPLPEHSLFQRMQIGTDVFILSKFYADAPIDETTRDVRFLGVEPDVYLNWQITSDLTLALRYGVFFPDDRAFASDTPRQFFYGGLTFSF